MWSVEKRHSELAQLSPAWIQLLMPSFPPEIDEMSIREEALFLVLDAVLTRISVPYIL